MKRVALGLVVMVVVAGSAVGVMGQATRPAGAGEGGVALPDEKGVMRVYPTNLETIKTVRAGVLNLCAEDIPRCTQTGPLPEGMEAGARHGVIAPVPHDPALPTIWTIGDSTVRTGVNGTGDDRPGQWGWGTPFVGYFDAKKVNVVNRAVGGTTSGSFYEGQWKALVGLIKPGDVVIMQFGTNSGGVELRGTGEETEERPARGGRGGGGAAGSAPAGATVTAHTFGWFERQMIEETKAKGATAVVCSLIPRNARGADGKITRSANTQAGWARETAATEKVGFIDLNELVARKYDALDKGAVDALFAGSPHTSWTGAVLNAETVIAGLKGMKEDPVGKYYVEGVEGIAAEASQ